MRTSDQIFAGDFPAAPQLAENLLQTWSEQVHKYSKMYYGIRPDIAGLFMVVEQDEYGLPSVALSADNDHDTPEELEEFMNYNHKFFQTIFNQLPPGAAFYGRWNSPSMQRDSIRGVNLVNSPIFYVEGCIYPSQEDTSTPCPEKMFTQYSDVTYILGLPSAGAEIINGKIVYERGIAPIASYPDVHTLDLLDEQSKTNFLETLNGIQGNVDKYIQNLFNVKGAPCGVIAYPMFSSAPTSDTMARWTVRCP